MAAFVSDVKDEDIESFLLQTYNRPDICVIIICTSIAHRIQNTLKKCDRHTPIIAQVPLSGFYKEINPNTKKNTPSIDVKKPGF